VRAKTGTALPLILHQCVIICKESERAEFIHNSNFHTSSFDLSCLQAQLIATGILRQAMICAIARVLTDENFGN